MSERNKIYDDVLAREWAIFLSDIWNQKYRKTKEYNAWFIIVIEEIFTF